MIILPLIFITKKFQYNLQWEFYSFPSNTESAIVVFYASTKHLLIFGCCCRISVSIEII